MTYRADIEEGDGETEGGNFTSVLVYQYLHYLTPVHNFILFLLFINIFCARSQVPNP